MQGKFNPWPYSIVLFFALLFCALTAFVVIAATHRDSMVSENYYEQELKYQGHIDGAARAQQSGATVNFDNPARRLVISLPATQAGRDLSGQVELYRPSAAGLDRKFKLQPDAEGRQSFDLAGLPEGPWEIRVSWNAGGQDYFLDRKIVITAK